MLRLSSYLDHMHYFGFYSHFQHFQLVLNTYSFGGLIIQFTINHGLKSCPNFQIGLIGKSINLSVLPLSPFSKPFITSLNYKLVNFSTFLHCLFHPSVNPSFHNFLNATYYQLVLCTFMKLSV